MALVVVIISMFADNTVISMSAATFNGSEADGFVQVCAELTFGVIEGNITLSVRTLDSGDGEHHYSCSEYTLHKTLVFQSGPWSVQ